MVHEGRDYLFYRYARHAGAIVALVATRRHLFIIPHSMKLELDLRELKARTLENPDVPALLSLLLVDPDLTLDALEATLRSQLAPEHVISLDETTIRRPLRFFRRVRIHRDGQRRPYVLSLGSRRNHARFDQYFRAA
jgi:hypothetical protein